MVSLNPGIDTAYIEQASSAQVDRTEIWEKKMTPKIITRIKAAQTEFSTFVKVLTNPKRGFPDSVILEVEFLMRLCGKPPSIRLPS